MATTLKLRTDIKKLKGALSSKSLPAPIKAKLKAQLDKAQNELKAMQSGAKPRKVSTTKGTQTSLTSLQKLVNKKKFGIYKGKGIDLKKDAEEGALAVGRRVSKGLKGNQFGDKKSSKGHIYYEYRANRLDVKQPKKAQKYPKLEDGGMMAKGGFFDTKGDVKFKFSENEKIKVLQYDGGKLKKLGATIIGQYAAEQPDGTYYPFYWVVGDWNNAGKQLYAEDELIERHGNKPKKMADGGMMAKGGNKSYAIIYLPNNKKVKKSGYQSAYKAFSDYESEGSLYAELYTNGNLISTYPKIDKGGYMADGGELNVNDIINKFGNYINTDEAQKKWDNSTEEERLRACGYNSDYQNVKFKDLPIYVKSHVSQYYFLDKYGERTTNKSMFKADGGMMAKGGDLEKFWDNLDFTTRAKVLQHLYIREDGDNAQIYEYYNSINKLSYSDWDKLPKNIKSAIEKHEGKLEKGGYMAQGGALEHGLKVGDTIRDVAETSVAIYNVNDKKSYVVNLDKGERTPWIIGSFKDRKKYAEDGGMMEGGGVTEKEVVESNNEMVLSQIKAVKHHADELSNIVNKKSDIEAWVVAKIERASTDLSDITHYLDGQHEKMSMGGSINNYVHKMDKK